MNQHSIGLQYVKIELAINDKDEKEEFKAWEKYFPLAINKSKAESQGYFWAVKEYKLLENSAVLFGSNELTPTLEVVKGIEPAEVTQTDEPADVTRKQLRKFI